MNRSKYIDYIIKKLTILSDEIYNLGLIHLLNLNTHLENFIRDFFNVLFEYELVNLNKNSPNARGIDLIDNTNKILIQVTSECSKSKIESSLNSEICEQNPEYIFIFVTLRKQGARYQIKHNKFQNNTKVKFDNEKFIYDLEKLTREINDADIDKLKNLYELCQKEFNNTHGFDNFDVKYLTLKPSISRSIREIIGRSDVIETVSKNFSESTNIVLLLGMGGIGKTAICKHIFSKSENQYDYLAWVDYDGDFKLSMVNAFKQEMLENRFKESEIDKKFDWIIAFLANSKNSILLVIDNIDRTVNEDTSLDYINKLSNNCHILLGSRTKLDAEIIEIKGLKKEDAIKLFYRSYSGQQDDRVAKIIEKIYCHPLMIELIAKTIEVSSCSLDDIYALIENFNLGKIEEEVSTQWGNQRDKSVIMHLYELYKFDEDNKLLSDEERKLLEIIILFKENTDINKKDFKQIAELSNFNVLNNLFKKGWLLNSSKSFQIHAIVKTAIKTQIKLESINYNIISKFTKILERGMEGKFTDVIHNLIHVEEIYNYYESIKDENLGFLMLNIGMTYYTFGRYKESLRWNIDASKMFEEVLGKNGINTADSYNNIGIVYSSMGKYEESLTWHNKSLKINEKVLGKNDINTAKSYNNIGLVYGNMGKYEESLIWYNKSLKINEEVSGKNGINTADNYNNIGLVYREMGKYEESLIWLNKCLKIKEKVLGKNDISTAISYNNTGVVYGNMGKYEESLTWYNKSLKIREEILGKNDINTADSYNNIASVYSDMGKYEESLTWYGKSLKINEEVIGKNDIKTADSYNNIGLVYSEMGKYEESLIWLNKCLKIKEKVLGKNDINTADSYNNTGVVYGNMEKYEESLTWYNKSLKIREEILGKNDINTAESYHNIASVYGDMGKYEESLTWYGKSLKINEEVLGENDIKTAINYNNIGAVYGNMGKYEESLTWYNKSLKIREEILGENDIKTAENYNNIGLVYSEMGAYEESLIWHNKALKITEEIFGMNHTKTIEIIKNINVVLNITK